MPIVILGVIFAVALGAYWIISAKAIAEEDRRIESKKKVNGAPDAPDGSGDTGNVIFLPRDLEREKARHHRRK